MIIKVEKANLLAIGLHFGGKPATTELVPGLFPVDSWERIQVNDVTNDFVAMDFK